MPRPEDLNVAGLDVDPAVLKELTTVPPAALRREVADIRAYLQGYGAATPGALYTELDEVDRRLGSAGA
jgi:GTP-dependent phosphoenolpyruvate carboxykinase